LPPKPPTTIWIVAVCYGQPPQFTGCCTKHLKRSSLLTALPPKPQTECMDFPHPGQSLDGRHDHPVTMPREMARDASFKPVPAIRRC
jgi:hypothetical protein